MDKTIISKRQTRKENKNNGSKVCCQSKNIKIIELLQHCAAVLYCAGTRWCISKAVTFENYINQNIRLFVLIEKGKKKWAAALYEGIGFAEYFDEEDNILSEDIVLDSFPQWREFLLTLPGYREMKEERRNKKEKEEKLEKEEKAFLLEEAYNRNVLFIEDKYSSLADELWVGVGDEDKDERGRLAKEEKINIEKVEKIAQEERMKYHFLEMIENGISNPFFNYVIEEWVPWSE